MADQTADLRIQQQKPLISPELVLHDAPLPADYREIINSARRQASNIIHLLDDRLLVIVGPCSIHDPASAMEYGDKLQKVISQYQNELCIIMRVYFEKPRTTVGWKGLINDPNLDSSFDINAGLRTARQLLLDLTQRGIPAGTEFLDTIIPQYISDLISWGAIGARTTESQIHRELSSGLSMPVGFKNGTDGNVRIAIDAVMSASHPHYFLGVNKAGNAAITSTTGNLDCHIILRGSTQGPNYSAQQIAAVTEQLTAEGLDQGIMIDCSHGNSNKDHTRQHLVVSDICQQISQGNTKLVGVMLESHLVSGRQPCENKDQLTYGQSITDACIGWEETTELLEQLADSVRQRRKL